MFLILTSIFIVIHSASLLFASDSVTVVQNVAQNVIGPDDVCKKSTNASPTGLTEYVPTTSAAEWQSFVAHPPAGVTLASCATNITVPAGTKLNLCTLAGNPAANGTYNFTINSGSVVGSNSTTVPALTTGTCWHAGQTLTLTNNGYIEGMGGAGGSGARYSAGQTGGTGGVALTLSYSLSLNNVNGHIFAGGGGGGGGSSKYCGFGVMFDGGVGGSGQGYTSQSGPTAPGTPGHGDWGSGGNGGGGGNWASPGGSGASDGTGECSEYAGPGGGGSGGPAITGSGYGITWIAVGDVRGPVQ